MNTYAFECRHGLGRIEKGLVGALLLEQVAAGPWQTNTYVLAQGPGGPCVVIDPGFETPGLLAELFKRHQLQPTSVILTHGHIDHVASVPEVSQAYSLPVWIHPDDQILLSEPTAGLSPESVPLLEQFYGTPSPDFTPAELNLYQDGQIIEDAGLKFRVFHSPGHTPGCAVLTVTDGEHELLISGDVLFNNGVGRTDLPRSSPSAMAQSLARIMTTFPDDLAVYPGHGPATTIGRERIHSQFLQEALRSPR